MIKQVILVAEDDNISRYLVVAILKKAGLDVISTTNGKLAVDQFSRQPSIDAVLMDIKMPVMDGIDATKIIKAISPLTPVIAATAYALSSDEDRFGEAGFDDCLSKPFDDKMLLGMLSKFGIRVSPEIT